MHANALRMFKAIGVKNGVLLVQAFYEDEEFYVYDTGFRLQSEASNRLIERICGYDQRELLINFAMTGSEGNLDLLKADDARMGGSFAASVWFLLREGKVGKIVGIERAKSDPRVVAVIQRLFEGDDIPSLWLGTEQQVMLRLFLVCPTRQELCRAICDYQASIHVTDVDGRNMLQPGFDAVQALEV